jgi:protein-tyrosine-phosphatase
MPSDSRGIRVLFVCSGNICRSPMALALAAEVLTTKGIQVDWLDSAGTLGIEDQPAANFAVEAVRQLGLDLDRHLSKGISDALVREADFIVVMAPEHVREIRLRHPTALEKTVRLWQYTDRRGRLDRIADPIGKPLEDYLTCRQDLLECLGNWADTLDKGTAGDRQTGPTT